MSYDEEDFLPNLRKEKKLEKKLAKLLDRSRYKKTDLDKVKEKPVERPASVGRVLAIRSQEIELLFEGQLIISVLKGSLKQDRGRIKNLIAVGDEVVVEEGFISAVLPRRSVLSRIDHLLKRHEQLIAANVTQLIITLSVVSPSLRPSLADRYIIAAEKGDMQPLIVVNKIDLLAQDPKEQELFDTFVKVYMGLGYPVIPISCETGEGLEALKAAMKDKTSVFSGQSGTGKSSLINLVTGQELRTRGIIRKTNKGMHTTTATRMIPLDCGGFCVDTPGIRSFGVWQLTREEVFGYFQEIAAMGAGCRFTSCSHTHEPGCAVIAAVEAGEISSMRYDSYCKLFEEAKSGRTAHVL